MNENGIKVTGRIPERMPDLRHPHLAGSSFVQRHLTKQLWNELKLIRTKYGGWLFNCVVAAVENPSLRVGLYACDETAYVQYKELFYPAIKELHCCDMESSPAVQHNFDISLLKYRKLSHAKKCIKYVQATASRNLSGYPFVPILDSLTKCAIESKLTVLATDDIDARLPWGKITEAQKKQFVNEGLLFGRHPSIESVVPDSKWSEGCSVYYKNDLSQVVWVNAEDHVQFFVTQKSDPDVRQVCERLFSKLKSLEESIPVCHDKNLGYVTCNPAWVGTALRIKVIVKLRKSADSQVKYKQLKEYCGKYKVQVRSVMQSTYEFVSAGCLQPGKTESDAVNELLVCINELLLVEEAACHLEEKLIDENTENEEAKEMPKFEELNTSLIRAFINKDIWAKYCQLTTSFGHTLKLCISPGMANHKIGLMALDPDCYEVFEDVFTRLIKVYHSDYRPVTFPLLEPESLGAALEKFAAAQCVADGYVMWQGNLKGISFPPGLTAEARKDCSTRLLSFLNSYYKKYEMKLHTLSEQKEEQDKLYFTDLMKNRDRIQQLSNDWPDQRRLISTNTPNVVLLTNVVNHLCIVSQLVPNFSLAAAKFFDMVETLVVKQLGFWSFTEQLGFQETLPTDIGNGFTVKVVVRPESMESFVRCLPAVEGKGLVVSIVDDAVHLSHKHKFKSMTQCLIDVMDAISVIDKK